VSAVVVDQAADLDEPQPSALDTLAASLAPVVFQLLRSGMAAAAWQVVVAHAVQADAAFWADLGGRPVGPVTASLRIVGGAA
jgi:hypothetical protein